MSDESEKPDKTGLPPNDLRDDLRDRQKLKGASVKGVAVNYVAQILRFAVQFISQVILARLLMPTDFGLVAMAAPLVAFIQLFADFGLTQATVQRQNITQQQLSFIFWINFSLSAVLGLATVAAAPLAAWFYGEERVTPIMMVLGCTFVLSGLYAQHLALLNRRMRFVSLALIDLISFGVGAVAGIVAALEGFGYWSIVISRVAISLSTLGMAWAATRWLPSWPKLITDARAILGFGGNITAFNVVNYFSRNLDNVLIGKYLGEAQLGLYDRAYKLLLLPLSQITGPIAKVASPLLSRLVGEPEHYRRAYLRLLETVLLLTYPGVIFAVIWSEKLIVTVLGARWIEAAPIFAILGIGGLFAPISSSTGWLFITQNRTREMRNCGALSSAAFVLSFIVGLPWGVIGVAGCYIAVGAVQGPLVWWAATRHGPVSFGRLMRALYPYALAGVVTAIAEYGLRQMAIAPIPGLILGLAAAYVVFVAVLLVTPGGRQAFRDVRNQMASLTSRLRQKS